MRTIVVQVSILGPLRGQGTLPPHADLDRGGTRRADVVRVSYLRIGSCAVRRDWWPRPRAASVVLAWCWVVLVGAGWCWLVLVGAVVYVGAAMWGVRS
jgi:hypothetical protein